MFELIEQAWVESSKERGERTLYVAKGSSCRKIANGVSMDVPELRTDHEEADTKIAYQHSIASLSRKRGNLRRCSLSCALKLRRH